VQRMKDFCEFLKERYPDDLLVIEEEVNPANFDVTAILRNLEIAGRYPVVFFKHPLDPSLKGNILTAKMIIDATRPLTRPFAERLEVPDEAVERMERMLKAKGVI